MNEIMSLIMYEEGDYNLQFGRMEIVYAYLTEIYNYEAEIAEIQDRFSTKFYVFLIQSDLIKFKFQYHF